MDRYIILDNFIYIKFALTKYLLASANFNNLYYL